MPKRSQIDEALAQFRIRIADLERCIAELEAVKAAKPKRPKKDKAPKVTP